MGFQKLKPKVIVYRNYKNFDNAKFRYDIVTATSNVDYFCMYKNNIFNIFNHHVPIKKKYNRANEAPFMSKELHEAIMKISRLRYKFLKHTTDTNKRNNNKQRKFCKKLLKNTKKSYFKNLDTKKISDNRTFCRTVLPLFTQNSSKDEKITLIDDSKIISSDEEICETCNQFFCNVVPTLNIPKQKSLPKASNDLDPIMPVIKYFDKHPSTVKIKAKDFDSTFHFRKTSCNEVENIISNLNIKKSCQKIFPLRSFD